MDQNTNTPNPNGMQNGMPPVQNPQPEKKIGPLVGTLIIIAVLIIAALYFFGQRLNTEAPPTTETPAGEETSGASTSAAAANADDIETIQAELNAELQNIEYSF